MHVIVKLKSRKDRKNIVVHICILTHNVRAIKGYQSDRNIVTGFFLNI